MYNTLTLPRDLDFPVQFEGTKVSDKKYVLNGTTGVPLDVVGKDFTCASHPDFFGTVYERIVEHLDDYQLEGHSIKFKSAQEGAWGLMEVVLPNVRHQVQTRKHTTDVAQRLISLHAINGTCSNQVYFGAIDFFCTNGLISGDHTYLKRKNSKGFQMDQFGRELESARDAFVDTMSALQEYAQLELNHCDGEVQEVLGRIMAERAASRMYDLYNEESATRGRNMFALYSALTNYASHADDTNGFPLRKSAKDRANVTMFKRQQQVVEWTSTHEWSYLKECATHEQ